jgi:hypothetical protein
LLIKSEIGDIRRFPNYKKLISWAGLAPSLYQSGSVERHGRITKQGSELLRWIMVECARVAVRHDARLGEFYERVRRRRGEQKAFVAVACKMLKIIWFMLTRREPYQSRNSRLYGEKLNSAKQKLWTSTRKLFGKAEFPPDFMDTSWFPSREGYSKT